MLLLGANWPVFFPFEEHSAHRSSFRMFPLEEITNNTCSAYRDQHPHTILYNILSGRDSGYLNNKLNHSGTARNCHCERRRTVCLKDPKATCQVASSVLVKTICFVRSLPSFSQLPSGDQSSLLRHCWVPLFVLGLAQEKIVFEVTDEPNLSILRQILLGPGLTEKDTDRPTLAEVHKLRAGLHQLWNLDLSPKEYAYLKGALLFNPAVEGLSALLFIEGLQQEAQRALQEVIHLLHPKDDVRFSHVLLAASAIQTVSHSLVTELFFKPVIGNTNMLHLLTEMLFVQ
ncbi:nuclear receptor subfamily 0, group B, member 2b [Dicentrarchus labrax]|uniref:Nuclear receptor subfamily 0, group B, member 2b n=2 Tax=Dicentrarchus labrax TaxID=13489 RepID=A0A8P4KSJ8_DICLA|nr:nuclear receptor subfamily 0, group B, member 2b [Dicentrarchus labrax]